VPKDPTRTSLALSSVGSVLVGSAWLMHTGAAASEAMNSTALTMVMLGTACFVGNLQGGAWWARVVGLSGFMAGLCAAYEPLLALIR
jgi:hypothetical protein